MIFVVHKGIVRQLIIIYYFGKLLCFSYIMSYFSVISIPASVRAEIDLFKNDFFLCDVENYYY